MDWRNCTLSRSRFAPISVTTQVCGMYISTGNASEPFKVTKTVKIFSQISKYFNKETDTVVHTSVGLLFLSN